MFKNVTRFKTKRKLRKNIRKKIKFVKWKLWKIFKKRIRDDIKCSQLRKYITIKWKFIIITKIIINIHIGISINKLKIWIKNKRIWQYCSGERIKVKII